MRYVAPYLIRRYTSHGNRVARYILGQPGLKSRLLGDIAGGDVLLDRAGTQVVDTVGGEARLVQEAGEGLGQQLVGHHVLVGGEGGEEGGPGTIDQNDGTAGLRTRLTDQPGKSSGDGQRGFQA